MKKAGIIIAALLVVAIIIYFGRDWISSAVSESVELEVAKMVDRENSNLPSEVDQGIILELIQNNPQKKELTFRYQFEVNIPADRFEEVENRTNQRVLNNKNLKRALYHGIKIFHQFSNPSGRVVLEFETTQ